MAALIDEIEVPDRPAIPGLRFRRFRGATDYPGMVAANQATRDAAGIQEVITVEGMANTYSHLTNSDPNGDVLVVERDGGIIGYARVEWRDQADGTRGFVSVCLLHPDHRRQGIGTAMLGWCEARSAANAVSLPDHATMPSLMQAFAQGAEAGAVTLLERSGWTRSGHGYDMVRPTLDDIPEVAMPAGLVVRPIGTDEASRRAVWEAAAEAFRDERLEPEWSEEDWLRELADPNEDPTLWVVAFDGDEIAGAVRGKVDPAENAHHGRERGIAASVFTRRQWRRRGLARALLARCLVRLRDHRMTSAWLGVDGLNPNQAMTLYSSLGIETASMSIDWTKPLPDWTGIPARSETP